MNKQQWQIEHLGHFPTHTHSRTYTVRICNTMIRTYRKLHFQDGCLNHAARWSQCYNNVSTRVQILSNHAPVKNLQIHKPFQPKLLCHLLLHSGTVDKDLWIETSYNQVLHSCMIAQKLDNHWTPYIRTYVRICTTMSLYCINVSTPLRRQESTELIYVCRHVKHVGLCTYVCTYVHCPTLHTGTCT